QTPGRHSTTRTSVREFRATVRVQVCAVRRCGYGSCVLTVMATEDMSDLAGMSLPVLEDELATLSAHLSAGMCRWLELVGELDRRAAGPSTTAVPRARTGYAKVRALTRVAEGGSEEELLELARLLTAAQLERAVRAYRRVTSEEAHAVHAD